MEKQTKPSTTEPRYEVVWPLGKAATDPITLSPPVSDLSGKKVGELWDWLFKGDQMFSVVRERLRARYPDINFVDYNVFGNTHGRKEREIIAALPDLLRTQGCEVVISGVGA